MEEYNKIQKPSLPDFKYIEKYLKKIDQNKVYSNFGELYKDFRAKLELYFSNSIKIIPTSSGTSAITSAILAKVGFPKLKKNLCILPSYTFVGTISAVVAAGYTPFLFDINNDWDIDTVEIINSKIFDKVGLIVPVSIYGRNVDITKWEDFTRETGIPVVIDAAASFDTLLTNYLEAVDRCVLCLSLHATKSFGVGEGGLILISKNEDESKYIRAINFGFYNSRESIGYSINAKMSEYQAAVGLACLTNWNAKLDKLTNIKNKYLESAELFKIRDFLICGSPISLSYCFFNRPDYVELKIVEEAFSRYNIDYRMWYGKGLHFQPQYKNALKTKLDNTDTISNQLIGIPMHTFLSQHDIEFIVSIIKKITL